MKNSSMTGFGKSHAKSLKFKKRESNITYEIKNNLLTIYYRSKIYKNLHTVQRIR
jgi:hypothetical protein